MANKLIFLSVKVTNPLTDERFTKDFRIAEALGQYIIQKEPSQRRGLVFADR
jgi:hypothetical protein